MKKYEVSEEFILEAHKAACSGWKQKLEKEFLEVFESKIEVWKWYKTKGGCLFYLSSLDGDKNKGYGFTTYGDWDDNRENNCFFGYKSNILREATDKEVEEALIAEAKRRGFEVGVRFKGLGDDVKTVEVYDFWNKGRDCENKTRFNMSGVKCSGGVIFRDGQWAEIIDNKSEIKEQVAKLQKELDILKSKL